MAGHHMHRGEKLFVAFQLGNSSKRMQKELLFQTKRVYSYFSKGLTLENP